MGVGRMILDAVVFIEPPEADLVEPMRLRRPDLRLLQHGEEMPDLSGLRYAVVTFDPGRAISGYRDAAWVHCAGAGVDKVLFRLDFTPPVITRTVGRMGFKIAEYVCAYVLFDHQKIETRRRVQERGVWDRQACRPANLHDTKAVIFGAGEIGSEIASRLGAFGVECVGVSRSGRAHPAFADCISFTDLKVLASWAGASILVGCLPYAPGAAGLIGEETLSMFRDALLINVGRGETLDEPGLFRALDAGHVRHAVLDVFAKEPPPPDAPVWSDPRIFLTPHISGLTDPAEVAHDFLDALDQLERGETPRRLVRPEQGY